jgi:hypothetical protein
LEAGSGFFSTAAAGFVFSTGLAAGAAVLELSYALALTAGAALFVMACIRSDAA